MGGDPAPSPSRQSFPAVALEREFPPLEAFVGRRSPVPENHAARLTLEEAAALECLLVVTTPLSRASPVLGACD